MGREFVDLFEKWAESYDTTVKGENIEYKDVFANYEAILNEVVKKSGAVVLEFGVGTGNLTKKLSQNNKIVFGIEPSKAMRDIARKKLGTSVSLLDGDFLTFPLPNMQVDTIVSTYAFHHLTKEEKAKAIGIYGRILHKGGKIVFADTAFINQEIFEEMVKESKSKHFLKLAADLETEYYSTHIDLSNIFGQNGFQITFTQMNRFVWLIEAEKME
ncbi:class I SAM-dependent methyltransferase [Metabacillus arenae]|uniref:Uncharacterized methyltransferase IC621_17655 n=1 Tax=Metabacillus arenae TaxID=2771434 RepID=A0A926NLA7_9BACI|nr:class I SAM-dependent methyltransferase [Metabacillus arenae]MBD1382058.1 class I SAM-dependent methyltransferase [Metabacillus arenae]